VCLLPLLSEGLADRKATLKEINELEALVVSAAVEYEDTKSSEDPDELMARLADRVNDFERLTVTINRTNNETPVAFDGEQMTIMQAVARRDALLLRHRATKRIVEAIDEKVYAKGRYSRYRTKDDVKLVSKIDPAKARRDNDELAERIRRLDLAIQRVNWTTDLSS
jgi:hypothetical protein